MTGVQTCALPISSAGTGAWGRVNAIQNGSSGAGGLNVKGFGNDFGGQLSAGDGLPEIFKRLGVFVNSTGSFGTKDRGTNESGYSFQSAGVTVGADYTFTENLLMGIAFGYENNDVDLHRQAGDLETNSYSGSAYGIFNKDNYYIDGVVSIGSTEIDTDRNIKYTTATETVDSVARGNTDAMKYEAGISGGYQFAINKFLINPYVGFDYSKFAVQGYDEKGGAGWAVHYSSQDIESIQSKVGMRSAYIISTPVGVIVPQLSAEWVHEYGYNQRTQKTDFVQDTSGATLNIISDKPDRDFMTAGFNISGQFAHDISGFVGYEIVLLREDVSNHTVSGGIRMQF